MPVRPFIAAATAELAELTDRLAGEWKVPNPSAQEPVILEERNSRSDSIEHVYVIWSQWGHLPRERRGEIIMDAAERVKSLDDVLKITIAMGLTPDEADQFGIDWR